MVPSETVPASWLPLGLRMVFQEYCPYLNSPPHLPDTPASRCPGLAWFLEVEAVSLLLALIPSGQQLFSRRFFGPMLIAWDSITAGYSPENLLQVT